MEIKKDLATYQKEYASEVNNHPVSYIELEKWGIPRATLSAEVYLRKLYGDEIARSEVEEEFLSSQERTVSKLNETEIDVDKELRNIYDKIEHSEFDINLEVLMKKMGDLWSEIWWF